MLRLRLKGGGGGVGAEARDQGELEGPQDIYLHKRTKNPPSGCMYIDHVSDTGGSGYILENLDPQTTYDLRFGSKNR